MWFKANWREISLREICINGRTPDNQKS